MNKKSLGIGLTVIAVLSVLVGGMVFAMTRTAEATPQEVFKQAVISMLSSESLSIAMDEIESGTSITIASDAVSSISQADLALSTGELDIDATVRSVEDRVFLNIIGLEEILVPLLLFQPDIVSEFSGIEDEVASLDETWIEVTIDDFERLFGSLTDDTNSPLSLIADAGQIQELIDSGAIQDSYMNNSFVIAELEGSSDDQDRYSISIDETQRDSFIAELAEVSGDDFDEDLLREFLPNLLLVSDGAETVVTVDDGRITMIEGQQNGLMSVASVEYDRELQEGIPDTVIQFEESLLGQLLSSFLEDLDLELDPTDLNSLPISS